MPFWLLAGVGGIFAWEAIQGDDQSGLPWSNVFKIALIAGAVYLAAKAVKAV